MQNNVALLEALRFSVQTDYIFHTIKIKGLIRLNDPRKVGITLQCRKDQQALSDPRYHLIHALITASFLAVIRQYHESLKIEVSLSRTVT